MDTTKTKTHAGPPLGSRWAQMWAYMWAEQLVIFWYMLPKVTSTWVFISCYNLRKCPQTFDVQLFKTSARQLNKSIALWQALDKIDQNGSHHTEESGEGRDSPTIVKRPVNNILTIFTSVLVVCISAVLAFVLIW